MLAWPIYFPPVTDLEKKTLYVLQTAGLSPPLALPVCVFFFILGRPNHSHPLNFSLTDIDECAGQPSSLCHDDHSDCINTDGGYYCKCQDGYFGYSGEAYPEKCVGVSSGSWLSAQESAKFDLYELRAVFQSADATNVPPLF